VSRSRPRALLLTAALLLALVAAGAARAQPSAWTPSERALALAHLAEWPGLSPSPPHEASDEEITFAVTAMARLELGQRLRPSAVSRLWAIEPPARDVAAELAAARRQGRLAAWLDSLPPPSPEYQALTFAARQYRAIVAAGGWSPLPARAALAEGDRGPGVVALRRRLAREGYRLPTTQDEELFDASVRSALSTFQRRHELPETGRLDAETRAALNVPASDRLAQIEANLERWRWLPHALPPDRVEVDTGSATATLFAHGAPVLTMKAIVGDPQHPTPMFASRLTAVVFDPPWNVPDSIAAAEIWPKAARDPGYLARNDFVVVDGRLQQRPGPKSALGLIKFDLPSPFGVYLHDTPAKSLFARRLRALSHGCMRLEKPQALAAALLAAQGWTDERVTAAMAAGRTQAVALQTQTPLYVVYRTAGLDTHGEIVFRADPYGWDRRLDDALHGAELVATRASPASECASPPARG
jgi:murein L,D-transpeptidase YcbB/YkuD